MKKTQLATLSIISSTLLLFTACGGDSSSNGGGSSSNGEDSNPSEETATTTPTIQTAKLTLPTKINIDIPDGFKNSRKTTSQVTLTNKVSAQKTTDTIPSRGYEQLTSTIEDVESMIKGVKSNMIYLGSMIPDIQTACVSTAINQLCTIPAGQISLTIDSSIQSDLKELQSEFDEVEEDTPPLNTTLTMGEILYTQFDSNRTYQHDIVFDIQPAFSNLGFNVTKMIETVRWSDDDNNVETISDVNDEYATYSMHLNYAKKEDNSSFMSIKNNFANPALDGIPASSATFTMKLSELNDANETVKVTSNGKYSDGTFSDSFNSNGEINTNGGYLNSTGTFIGSAKYAEKETFDSNGSLLQSKYCDEFDGATCSIADESTWHTFDDVLGIDSDEFSEEEFEEYHEEDENSIFEFKELTVEGGTLTDSMCFILPPNFIFTSEANLFEEFIGSIIVFGNEQEGLLEESSFENQLDDLKIFCLNEEDDIEELTGEDRPTLTINNE